MNKGKRFLLILLFTVQVSSAQQADSTAQWTTRKKVVVAGIAFQQVTSFVVQYFWWWKGDYHSFNVERDGYFQDYFFGIDKLGHAYTSYLYYNGINELTRYAGFSDRSRHILNIALPVFWAVSIEIGDGFSNYGYSHQDLVANMAGLGFAFLQDHVPYMRNFKFKMSYYPTSYYTSRNFDGWALTNDYRGHMYWMTFDVHNMLPRSLQKYWPAFMNLGFGYGLDKREDWHIKPIHREFGFSLDWNISAIFKTRQGTVSHMTKELVDYIHFPAPGFSQVEGESMKFHPILFR